MKYFLLLFMFASVGLIQAQEINIDATKSEVFKDNKKHTSLVFSEKDGKGGFVTIRIFFGGIMKTPKGYYIEHYNKDLKLVNEFEFEIDKSEIKGLMIDNDIIYILESLLDQKANTYSFNVLESPLGKFNFEKRTLLTLDEDKVKKYFAVGIGIFFFGNGLDQADSNSLGEVTFSSNKNFFCVNFDIKDKESQTQKLVVYDKKFNKVFEREFKRDIKDKYFVYENIDVDDVTGDLFLLGKVFENESTSTKIKGKANYHYELHKIGPTNDESVSFNSGENFVGSLFVVRGDNKISCAGFYSEKNDSRYKGTCRFNLDPSSFEVTSSSFLPFSEEFIVDKYGKVKDKELRNLSFRSGFLTANQDLVLNAEEFYTTTHTYMSPNGGMRSTTTFHYDDIVSVKISEKGELLWARNINKRQATAGMNLEYLSFSSTVVNDDTYIFINCSDKIRTISNNRLEFKQSKSSKSNLYAIKIDKDGNYTYKSIVDDKDTEVPYFVSQGVASSNNGDQMIFIGRLKSKKQFLKLDIK